MCRASGCPQLEEADEFYHADLIGLAVVDRAGRKLGTVVAIHNFGAGDLIEVRAATEGGAIPTLHAVRRVRPCPAESTSPAGQDRRSIRRSQLFTDAAGRAAVR